MPKDTTEEKKLRPEDQRGLISEVELEEVGEVYANFYKWKYFRQGLTLQFQNYSLEDMLLASRQLFWNSANTESQDLRNLGLDFSIPFARKETMDFLGRITSLNIKPHMTGDDINSIGMKVLNGLYAKWRFKSNDRVEKFWEMLYGLVNGTVCSYVGYGNTKLTRRYLESMSENGEEFKIKTKEETFWNDVTKEVVPLEDIYIPKIYERNIQKQGRLIWKTQMDEYDFHKMYDNKYENAKYAVAGNRIAEDSLYYRLLGGSGTTSYNKIEIMNQYDWLSDKHIMVASGMLLNKLGTNKNPTIAPMPFDHKMGPFTWGITSPLDEKIAYGLPTPFLVKDPHKILNTAITMMVEREFRAVDPIILSSDIESPEFIYGRHGVVPVNDVNAYKEFKLQEPSNQYFNMMNSLQSNMKAQAQGGDSDIMPSRQPKSSREVMEDGSDQQESMSNSVVMYYDLIRQEVLLVLKTMFQFYGTEKYKDADENTFRDILVPDMPLTEGGVGNLRLRIVKKKQSDMDIMLEAIRESALNGKKTEIVEIPVEWIQNLEVQITKIELEPENSSEVELSNFMANVIEPMINIYAPAGLADMGKIYLRHLEKMGESPADFSSSQVASSLESGKPAQPAQGAQPIQPGQPQPGQPNQVPPSQFPLNAGAQNGMGAQKGNMKQITTGTKFGARNNKGLPKRIK